MIGAANLRFAVRPALILALLGAPAGAGAEESALVIRVREAGGRPRSNASVVARCPGGSEWRATTDAQGFAVIASVPPCLLTVEAEASEPGDTIRVDRLESRAVAVLEEAFARGLPSSRTAWSLLETAEPAAIVDRVDGAGLHLADPGRFSMRGASWTQNAVLLDGVDLTDPVCGGTPLIDPDVDTLERIEAVSGLAPVEQAGPGVGIVLVPLAPERSWRGTVRVDALTAALQADEKEGDPPAIARFGSLADARASASGPMTDRLRVLLAARFGRVRRFEQDEQAALDASHVSGSGQLLYEPSHRDSLRLLTSAQVVHRPLAAPFLGDDPREDADALGAQLRWRRATDRATVSAFAGFWRAGFEPHAAGQANGDPVERLLDGPVPELIRPSRSRRSTWTVGMGLAPAASRLGGFWHAPRAGATLGRASVVDRPGADDPIPETVDGLPARVWQYEWAGPDSQRHVRQLAAWAADRVVLRDRLFVEAGLRLEVTEGTAAGAMQKVSWTTVSPRVSGRLRLTDSGRLTVFGGYADYPHRLLLAPLAFGDPNGPQASVYRWDDANGDLQFEPTERGVLVARVGPGAADGSLAAIDPDLRSPRTRELAVGLEASPGQSWRLRFTGFDRRERDLLESVNVGVPPSGYTVRYLPDPAGDIVGTQDDQLLPVYDRKPETFGLDRYLLTNPADHKGLHQAVELRVEKTLGRLALLAGGTASRTEIRGASRGFRVTENDQGVIGELHDNPNADTHASGRSFFDRAFTLKIAAAYRTPGDWRLGAVARYQDGQPFGRIVVVPDLAQGPEAVPATPRGQIARGWAVDEAGRYVAPSGYRFTYTLTLDARLEKGFALGGHRRLGLIAEAFNLLGARNEVEEDPVWGPGFRTPTAIQPPRAVRLGVRFDF